MFNKSLLRVGALALSLVTVASAKSYDVFLENATKVGNVQLARGTYKVKVEDNSAVFTDSQTRKAVSVPVKIDTGTKKYDSTLIDSTKHGSMDEIQTIELGGSTTKLEFGK